MSEETLHGLNSLGGEFRDPSTLATGARHLVEPAAVRRLRGRPQLLPFPPALIELLDPREPGRVDTQVKKMDKEIAEEQQRLDRYRRMAAGLYRRGREKEPPFSESGMTKQEYVSQPTRVAWENFEKLASIEAIKIQDKREYRSSYLFWMRPYPKTLGKPPAEFIKKNEEKKAEAMEFFWGTAGMNTYTWAFHE